MASLDTMHPRDLRLLVRSDEFEAFCLANRQALPLLDRLPPGTVESVKMAPGSDVRTDVPGYRVFCESGLVKTEQAVQRIVDHFDPDLVTFLIGCSFSFEAALMAAGVPVRHIEQGKNVPMFITNRPCVASGRFSCPLVVTMRPMPPACVPTAIAVTTEVMAYHGPPLHVGDPIELGISDVMRPDFGDAVTLEPGDTCVFWACGVTGLEAIKSAHPPKAITHAPGHMFVTDVRLDDQQQEGDKRSGEDETTVEGEGEGDCEPLSDEDLALLHWVQHRTHSYGLQISNFSTHWASGLALCALAHSRGGDALLDYRQCTLLPAEAATQRALQTLDELGVPVLLDAEDLTSPDTAPDALSVAVQVHQIREAFGEE